MDEKDTITFEDVDRAWARFMERADRAEQYQFPLILMYHTRLELFYRDLHSNWNEHHAKIFLESLDIMYKRLGWSIEERKKY